ncbi:hypothetical protein [Micromonospora halophytica]|uniref:Exo-alpha-sialidase n=1 Tax=Micromonospora halophytica TaxID=47864 RepID=A0A1C5HLV1_9ACTN|nr:hypothetical protein [Micromonospora halophytica]SCG46969.1 hypothetical protein GA0070560_10542 [Micromonospora halophytica]
MIGRAIRPLVALLLVPALVACSMVGDVRRDPPARTSAPPESVAPAPPPSPSPSPQAPAEVRVVQLAVPQRYDQPHVEFVDADHGWALFATCDGGPPGRNCPALLFGTVDGGRSWRSVRHPRPVADGQQLYAARGLLVLFAEPHGWYSSIDGGVRFAHTVEEPVEWRAAQGRFQIIERTGRIGEWAGGRLRQLDAQPPVPRLNTVGESGGLLVVAAGAAGGKPYAAVSFDRGRNWLSTSVPAPEGEVGLVRALVEPDGTAWLVGERPDRTGWPGLWRLRGGWEPVGRDGHPAEFRSVAPIGGGLLAVIGPRGAGVVGDGYADLPWPVGPEHYLRVLADTTLAATGPGGEVLLGVGYQTDRRWIRVIVAG